MGNLRTQARELAERPYIIETQPSETTDGSPSWVAYVMELDGCIGQGETREEAVEDVKSAMVDFIETMLEYGLHIPEPQRPRTFTAGAKVSVMISDHIVPPDEQSTNRHVAQLEFSLAG